MTAIMNSCLFLLVKFMLEMFCREARNKIQLKIPSLCVDIVTCNSMSDFAAKDSHSQTASKHTVHTRWTLHETS